MIVGDGREREREIIDGRRGSGREREGEWKCVREIE